MRRFSSTFLLLLVMVLLVGCSDADKRRWTSRTAQQNFTAALDAGHADERRDAVVRIGESRYFTSEEAFAVLDAVARTDPAAQIRCIAIRILGRYGDARPVATMLGILEVEPDAPEALPANEDVRWEAATALEALAAKGLVAGEQVPAVRDLYIGYLRSDPNRNVRIVAARALGRFEDRAVFDPLFKALRSEDFMIADTSERSLIALTGVTHEYDADAWSAWLEKTPDPFTHAGRVPVTTRPAGPSWWDHQQRAWKRALKLNAD